jgi:hypothetical protein
MDSLLYHALHILLRRPYLSSASRDPGDRNIKSCIEHSKKVHAIHSLYSRTFPHRLMTYQVSYCIYTAATVESEELKRASTQKEREDAATRLAAAFRILQQEASHTPGSGRSLETIRRLLSTGPPRATNVGSNSDHNQPPTLGQINQGNQANQHQLENLGPRNGGNGPEQTTDTGHRLLSTSVQSTSYNHNNNGNNSSGHPRLASGVNPSVYESSFLSMDVSAWDDEFSLGGTDTGAGFHPDAFPWGVAGPVLRNPGSSSFASNGVVWPPI